MKFQPRLNQRRISASKPAILVMIIAVILVSSCADKDQAARIEEITFQSGPFSLVGELRLPEGNGPFPVVIFVHGDGPNDRTSGGTYPPIMERMARVGYATFAWDKPGTGESTGQIDPNQVGAQRAQIVLDAIEILRTRADIDEAQIGLWGISQAGYVMPRVLMLSDDIAFMIAVSTPGVAGVDQGAYLVSAQAMCSGVSEEDALQMRELLAAIERVETYEEYVRLKVLIDALPGIETASIFGFRVGVRPEDEWHAPNLQGEYFWDPIEVIEQTAIPVLAFFGGLDTQIDPVQGAQAYREALERAGNSNFRVELIPGVDHNLILSETGCLVERENRSRSGWTRYAPEYLDILEQWLMDLRRE